MSSAQNFHQNIHTFRALAILMIIGAHTVPSFDWKEAPLFGKFIDILCNQSSIYFFFIAGFLFLHLSDRYETSKYYKQKIRTVLLPYLLISIPALITFTTIIPREGMWSWFYDLDIWQQIALFLLTGKHLAPLWFVPTIAIFYLLAPVFLKINRSLPICYLALIPLFAISIVYGRDGSIGPIDKARYLAVAYFFGMFYCRHYAIFHNLATRFWWLLLLAGGSGFWLCWIDYASPHPPVYQMVQKLAWAPLALVILDRYKALSGPKTDYVASISFGLFFVHAYFIAGLKVGYTRILTGSFGGASDALLLNGTPLKYIFYWSLVVITSVATVAIAKRIFGQHSRIIVGA